jgi:xanthine dehydrogenase accessory factor
MKELLDMIGAWRTDGVEIGRAVVLRTYGSAPRPPGSVLIYSSDGRIAGSVSGGCVEAAAAGEIDEAGRTGLTRTIRLGITDEQAWSVGLACGGTIDVLIEPGIPDEAIAAASQEGGSVVITPLPGEQVTDPQPRLVFRANGGLQGTTGNAQTDSGLIAAADEALLRGTSAVTELNDREYFLEAFPVRPRLVIVGAVETARVLVRLARELNYETVVTDGRSAYATRERFPDTDQLIATWPDEAFGQIGLSRDDFVVVLTHDPKFDDPAIVSALRRGCRYVGAIGSRKTQAERRARLAELGVRAADLERLHGPIGLDLGGRAPAETALAILSEVVATRYGTSGEPLHKRSAPVAAAVAS